MQQYRTRQGDTWDLIAYQMYGNELLMQPLLEANGVYREVVLFSEGIMLNVPDLAEDAKWLGDAPPWRDVE